jgi:predicted unusual protein kinase regulating ubiquinone biosynthesis (AarF/ABC1/UbiB family)
LSKITNHHGDLHWNNVVLKLHGNHKPTLNKYKVALIDFGLTDKRSKTDISIEIEMLVLNLKAETLNKISYHVGLGNDAEKLTEMFIKYLC